MKMLKKFMPAIVGIFVVSILAAVFWTKPAVIEVGIITRGSFQQTIDEDGKTRTRDRYIVSSPLAGNLRRMRLKAGDRVDPDEILATIIPSLPPLLDVKSEKELKERLGAAEAEKLRTEATVERAKVSQDQAKAEYERNRKLADKGFISNHEVEVTEFSVKLANKEWEVAKFQDDAAGHEVETARAALARIRREVLSGKRNGEKWDVRSPVRGRVLKVLQENEGYVSPGTPLVEIGDPADLEIVTDILTSDAVLVHPGDRVRIERWGGPSQLNGRVRLIEPSAFTKMSSLGVEEQRVNIIIDIISPSEEWVGLKDGFRLDVHIIVFNSDNAVKVPASALFREEGHWSVFVVSKGRVQKRVVEVNRRSGLEGMVGKGLDPGEKVVIYPSDEVKDGYRVKIKQR